MESSGSLPLLGNSSLDSRSHDLSSNQLGLLPTSRLLSIRFRLLPLRFFGFFWIFAVFWFIRWAFWPWRGYGPRRSWRYGDQAYYTLRERYARGEITKEQFDQMTRDLQQHNQGYQNM